MTLPIAFTGMPNSEKGEVLNPPSDAVVEDPQPMEVVPAEAVTPAGTHAGDDPVKFTWKIKEFSKLDERKQYSEVFYARDCKWRVLIFPKGNNVVGCLSVYLDVADSEALPNGWSIYAKFTLAIVNQIHDKSTFRKDSQYHFREGHGDIGFPSFMPLSELYEPDKGYIVNDTCIIEAKVVVRPVSDYWSYDSKKETGYVGLKNQGATCYMNSLLQTLYHLPYFRKAVYHMPTTENDVPSSSLPLALQSLFYELQTSNTTVATKEFTDSFGWTLFIQQDIQEFNRILCQKLELKMQGTVMEDTFQGHSMSYIECINIDKKSKKMESYYDLQLVVRGCQDIYASFDKYVEVESLTGENKYNAEEYGMQDARKGILFVDFPPVLQLHLKRFEYVSDNMGKINDRYEFPLQLDLDIDDRKYMSPDADRSVRNLYTLHSVLVHSGGVRGGHYYAYIRPTLCEQWFKFDDDIVTKVDKKWALEEQYGGEEQYSGEEELPNANLGLENFSLKSTKCSSAYMLVYIRKSDKERILCDVDEKDVAEHLRIRLKNEKGLKDQQRKENAEAHLYTVVKVARDNDLVEQIGRNVFFDLVNHEKVQPIRIEKQMIFSVFKEEMAKKFDIPVHLQRFWLWAKRRNLTYRPNRPLTSHEEAKTVGQLREISNLPYNEELKLFLEVELGVDMKPVSLPDRAKDDILLFFKLYDPCKLDLRYVGRLFVKGSEKPTEILAKLNKMADFSPDEEIDLFEEVKFYPNVLCKLIDKKFSFRRSELEDGDVICYQKSLQGQNIEKYMYADVPSYLDYVSNFQTVRFRSLEKPKDDEFCLQLSRKNNYDEVVQSVANHIGLTDPSKISLTSHNCYAQLPKAQPIRYRGVDCLTEMLVHDNQFSNILYYEVLDMPLPEFEGLKSLEVTYHHATKDEVDIHIIRLPMQSTVGDALGELKTKVELSHPDAELRLLEIFHHKICKIYPLNERIENVNDQYITLQAEEIPEEEKTLSPNDQLIHVTHFVCDTAQNQMVKNFGEPFLLVIHEGETLIEVKARIQQKLQVPEEDFSKWKLVIMSSSSPPEYLEDSNVISTLFQKRDDHGPWEPYLGLEHTDPAPRTLPVRDQNGNSLDKPVKICD